MLGDIREAIPTVFAKTAVFSEHTGVHQALEHTVSEAGVSHVVEAWEHVKFLELGWV